MDINTPQTDEVVRIMDQRTVATRRIYIFVALLVLAIFSVMGYTLKRDGFIGADRMKPVLDTNVASPEASGNIILTLVPDDRSHMGLYSFDVKAGTLAPYLLPKGKTAIVGGGAAADSNILPLASNMEAGTGDAKKLQIFLHNTQSGIDTKVTTSDVSQKRNPTVAANGSIAFSGSPVVKEGIIDPEDLVLYLIDRSFADKANSVEVKIGRGMFPHFSPDGSKILYLGNAGLYLYDSANKATSLVWQAKGGAARANMQFSVSDKGDRLAWTNPNTGIVSLFRINVWDPFSMVFEKEIPVYAFWPVFSPDGAHLALEVVDVADEGRAPNNQRLMIYDLTTLEGKVVQDLKGFVQSAMYINEWVNN